MARREGHLLQVGRVPGAEDDTAIVGVVPQLVDDLGELVDTLARIVGLRVYVFGTKVPPLKPVDGA
jgi:hypothetical protein